MPPENNHVGGSEEWLRFAKSDLELSRIDPPPSVLLESFCFHAQQAAERRKKAKKNRDAAFYEGVVRTAEYFIQTILPITQGKMASIKKSNDAVMEIPEASFGGK